VKNGLGKEYSEYTGELIFEGDYLKGKKWNGNFYDLNNVYEIKGGNGFVKTLNF